jgi:hypothetical protein
MASGVECKLLCSTSQEFYATPVSDSDEEVQIQRKRFGPGKDPAAATVRRNSISLGVRSIIPRNS